MSNLMSTPTNFNRRVSAYVPAMTYSADVNYNGGTRVNFGAPFAASATSILNAGSIATAGQLDLSPINPLTDFFGRNVVISSTAGAVGNIGLFGFDYLGQPVTELFAMNGVTPVIGNKCFKSFSYVTYPAVAGGTLTIGTGVKLGIPYKAVRVAYEIANGALAAAGTFQVPSLIDPQTSTTTDPRGAYTPTTTMNGANIISAVFDMLNDVNTSNRGGLHGLPHAAS